MNTLLIHNTAVSNPGPQKRLTLSSMARASWLRQVARMSHGGTLGESEPDFGLKLRNAPRVAKVLSQQSMCPF